MNFMTLVFFFMGVAIQVTLSRKDHKLFWFLIFIVVLMLGAVLTDFERII